MNYTEIDTRLSFIEDSLAELIDYLNAERALLKEMQNKEVECINNNDNIKA